MKSYKILKPKTKVIFVNGGYIPKGTVAKVLSYDWSDRTYLIECLNGQWTGEAYWVHIGDIAVLDKDGI